MVKFILNKKSLMTFGKWSLALFSLVLLGFFVVQYVIPALAMDPPTQTDDVVVTLITPANNGYRSSSNVNFTYNVTWHSSFNIQNCTLFGNFTDGTFDANVTNVTMSLPVVNDTTNGLNTSLSDGLYEWNVYCYNATNHGNYSTSNFTVTVDTVNPILNTSTPADESYIKGSDGQVFQVYIYDTNLNVSNVTFWYRKLGAVSWTTNTSASGIVVSTPNMNCYSGSSATQYICNVSINDLYDTFGEGNMIEYYYEAFDNATNYNSNGTRASPWNVTIDRTAPWFSSDSPLYASGQAYAASTDYGFQINVVDKISNSTTTWTSGAGVAKVLFEANFSGTLSNTTASGTNPYYVNFTGGQFANATVTYAYRWYTNDSVTPSSDGNWNTTSFTTYSLSKASNAVTLYINGTTPTGNSTTFNYTSTINATVTDAGNTYNGKIYRDNVDVTSENNTAKRLAANTGGYLYRANTTGNENYTSNNTNVPNFYVIVDKAPVTLTMYLDNTQNNNITVASGASVNMTVVSSGNDLVNTEGTLFIYKGGTEYNQTSDATTIMNISTITGNALQEFNITGYFNGSQNYSAATPIEYYIKIESTTPTYADVAIMWAGSDTIGNLTNNSVIGNQSSAFNISTNWTDNEQLNYYWLMNSTDDGSNFSNTTALAFVASGNLSNITINPGQYVGGTVLQFRICANDTTNNQNCTSTYRYTIDGTTPILNTTSPTPNTYLRRSSSQLFQIYVYDQTLNVSNATLYYKESSGGSWTASAGNMNCYGTSPLEQYICNKTVDLTIYGDGNTIYYFFEAFDNSSIKGSNGSTSSYNQITLDDSAPEYSNNGDDSTTISKYGTVSIYTYWNDQRSVAGGTSTGRLSYAILATNESGAWENKTGNYSGLAYLVGNITSWSNFTWGPNTSLTSGTGVSWRIYVNDSAGNENVTADGTFTVDGTKPTYDNNNVTNVTHETTITKSTPILISFNWTDDVGLGWAWLSTNETGGWVNYSSSGRIIDINLSGTQTWSNFTWQNTSVSSGMEIAIKIYANDTSGNENVTDTMVWTIDSTKPTYTNNGTNVNEGETIVKGTPISIYANWTDQELHGWWVETNASGTLSNTTFNTTFGTGNWTNYTITTNVVTGTVVQARIFVNDTSGNLNYTIPTWNWTIDGTVPSYYGQNDSISGETVYAPGASYILNISWTDNLGIGNVSVVTLEWNGSTNYTSTSNPAVQSIGSGNYSLTLTDLGTYNYTYKWYANDTSGNGNVTTIYALNITQNTTNIIDIYLVNSSTTVTNGNMSISAGNTVTVNGTFVYQNAGTMALYSNVTTEDETLTDVGSPVTTSSSLGAGVYLFIANTTGTVNYTANATGPGTFYLTITSDVTAPTVLLYDYNNATAKKAGAELILNISVSDATGITSGDSCNVTINGTVNTSITYSGGWCNGTITVPSGTEGTHVINITVKDNSTTHNVGINSTFYIIIDNTAPIITISTPSNNTYNKLSGSYIWINGSVTDALQMGTGNVTISGNNASQFTVYNFTGISGDGFAIYNNTTVSDGLVELTISYTDNATNSVSNATQFYVDNTGPTSFTAVTTGTKAKNSSQIVQVNVTDNLMTNTSITLYYYRYGYDTSWQTTTMTGTPGATTTYTITINTNVLGITQVGYYVIGVDNATNPFSTNNGSATSPLGNFTVGDTTAPSITSTSPSGTITDNTPTLVVNTSEAGYCKYDTADKSMSSMANSMTGSSTGHEATLSTLTDNYYTYYVRCNDTYGNEMSTGTSIAFDLDTRSLFNITKPDTKYSYFTASKWWSFALPLWTLQTTTLTYYNVTSVLASVSGNYNNFYADIGNNNTWRSYVPGRSVNSFTDFTYNGSASIYYIYVNTTDRIEIN